MSFRLTILLTLIVSCNKKTEKWNTLNFGGFQIKAPSDWQEIKKQGFDANIGGLTNGTDSLSFYYGWYISGFSNENADQYFYSQDTVNGKLAEIRIPKKRDNGMVEMFIRKAEGKYKFEISGKCTTDTALLFKIFRSVRFKSSDTGINGSWSSAKFKEYPFGSGRTIYQVNCTTCHFMDKDMAGPALSENLISSRSDSWYFTFFCERKNLQYDSALLARKKIYGNAECIELPNYTKPDIKRLINYLR